MMIKFLNFTKTKETDSKETKKIEKFIIIWRKKFARWKKLKDKVQIKLFSNKDFRVAKCSAKILVITLFCSRKSSSKMISIIKKIFMIQKSKPINTF